MKKIDILTESGADLSKELAEKLEIYPTRRKTPCFRYGI